MTALTHSTGYDMQAAINENTAAAALDHHDFDACWACYNAKQKISVGSLCFMPHGCRSPESLVEITCPDCNGTREDISPFTEEN